MKMIKRSHFVIPLTRSASIYLSESSDKSAFQALLCDRAKCSPKIFFRKVISKVSMP